MKKILITILLFISTISYAQQVGQNSFIIKANHYYEFTISLNKDTIYNFEVKAEKPGISIQMIEPSGNEWESSINYFGTGLFVTEHIHDAGVYKIKIRSIVNNEISLTWSRIE